MTDECDELMEGLGHLRVRWWRCPIIGHRGGPIRVEVEWVGDVAHCTWPGCGRTSIDRAAP